MSGQRGILVHAMYLKYALANVAMPRDERLKTLEQLGRLPFADVTAAAIAVIEPCSHDVARMIGDAMDLPPKPPSTISQGWTVLETEPVWSKLVAFNPSLETAMNLCRGFGRAAA
jgi:hypothetical protein